MKREIKAVVFAAYLPKILATNISFASSPHPFTRQGQGFEGQRVEVKGDQEFSKPKSLNTRTSRLNPSWNFFCTW
jgi:hypothetical protein